MSKISTTQSRSKERKPLEFEGFKFNREHFLLFLFPLDPSRLDFGFDFLFAHPGGPVLVGLVVERVQGLHQPTVVLRGGRRDFVHVERKSPLDDSPLEENADCGRNVHPEPFEQVAHLVLEIIVYTDL